MPPEEISEEERDQALQKALDPEIYEVVKKEKEELRTRQKLYPQSGMTAK